MSKELKNKILSKLNKRSLADFLKELKSLDMKEYGTWSQPVKIATWVIYCGLSAILVFILLVNPKFDSINFEKKSNEDLLEKYKVKHAELIKLESQQAQIDKLKAKFQDQLDRLPKQAEITGLIDDIGRISNQSGFRNVDLSLGQEQEKGFYVEQPITVTGVGTFHSFGNFMTSVSSLPRIITVDSYKIVAQPSAGHKDVRQFPVLKYTIEAKTYRHLEKPKDADTKADSATSLKDAKAKAKAKADKNKNGEG